MDLLQHIEAGAAFTAFPLKNPALVLNSTNWNANKVTLNESATGSGLWSALVDTAVSDTWLVFAGTLVPATYNDRRATWQQKIASGNSGSGNNLISIAVTSSTVPVRGALVTIQQSGVIVYWAITDGSGLAQFGMSSGSFTVTVTATGFTPIIGQALNVSANATVPLAMTQISITPPGNVQLCTIQFSVVDANGPIDGCLVKAELDVKNSTTDGNLIAMTTTVKSTDSNGLAYLSLIRQDAFTSGGIYHFTVEQPCGKTSFDKRAYVPNQPTATADDLVGI